MSQNGTYYGIEFRRVVLIMQRSFCGWYLLWIAVSNDGTYLQSQVPPNRARIIAKMVLIRYLLIVSMVHIMDSSAIERNTDLVVFFQGCCRFQAIYSLSLRF